MDKIIIEVSEGLVQAVYSNRPNVEVSILDLDTIDNENITAEQQKLLDEKKYMKKVL